MSPSRDRTSWSMLVREIGIEHVDVDADQRAGAQADAVARELPAHSLDRRLVDRDRRPAPERRTLLAGHDRQRQVAVVEELERGAAEGRCANADAAAAGRLWVLLSVGGAALRGRRHRLLRATETQPLEGEHVLEPVADAAVQLQPGRPLAVGAPALERPRR